MTPVGTLPMVRKSTVDRTGIEIGAAKKRVEFHAFDYAGVMPTSQHANISDFHRFPNQ